MNADAQPISKSTHEQRVHALSLLDEASLNAVVGQKMGQQDLAWLRTMSDMGLFHPSRTFLHNGANPFEAASRSLERLMAWTRDGDFDPIRIRKGDLQSIELAVDPDFLTWLEGVVEPWLEVSEEEREALIEHSNETLSGLVASSALFCMAGDADMVSRIVKAYPALGNDWGHDLNHFSYLRDHLQTTWVAGHFPDDPSPKVKLKLMGLAHAFGQLGVMEALHEAGVGWHEHVAFAESRWRDNVRNVGLDEWHLLMRPTSSSYHQSDVLERLMDPNLFHADADLDDGAGGRIVFEGHGDFMEHLQRQAIDLIERYDGLGDNAELDAWLDVGLCDKRAADACQAALKSLHLPTLQRLFRPNVIEELATRSTTDAHPSHMQIRWHAERLQSIQDKANMQGVLPQHLNEMHVYDQFRLIECAEHALSVAIVTPHAHLWFDQRPKKTQEKAVVPSPAAYFVEANAKSVLRLYMQQGLDPNELQKGCDHTLLEWCDIKSINAETQALLNAGTARHAALLVIDHIDAQETKRKNTP